METRAQGGLETSPCHSKYPRGLETASVLWEAVWRGQAPEWASLRPPRSSLRVSAAGTEKEGMGEQSPPSYSPLLPLTPPLPRLSTTQARRSQQCHGQQAASKGVERGQPGTVQNRAWSWGWLRAEGVPSCCRSVPRAWWTKTPSNSFTRSSSLREVSPRQGSPAVSRVWREGTLLLPLASWRLGAAPVPWKTGTPNQDTVSTPSWGCLGWGMSHQAAPHTPACSLPSPDATTYAHFLFNAFDADGNGAIHFEVGPRRFLPHVLPLWLPG